MAVAPSLETAVAEPPRPRRTPEAPETQRPFPDRHPGRDAFPVKELEFPGCYSRPMTVAEFETHEGRIEFFDTRTELAWVAAETPHFVHEAPRAALARLVQHIAQVRGSRILCLGDLGIRLTLFRGEKKQSQTVQPDGLVYLHPAPVEKAALLRVQVGESMYPDVLFEVDNTTDVRKNRLKLYEAWGFPEVWVEVPNRGSRSRPRSLKPGLTIHLLEEGRFVESEASRAFPGWGAEEIHQGLNEWGLTEKTLAALSRVGRALGGREGTGPEDDLLLRQHRAEGRAEVARAILQGRGILVPTNFPEDLPPRHLDRLQGASGEHVFTAATAAVSFHDFLSSLEDPGR